MSDEGGDDYDEYDDYDGYDDYDEEYKECVNCDCPYDSNYDKGTDACKCKSGEYYDYNPTSDMCRCEYNESDPQHLNWKSKECECAWYPYKTGCPDISYDHIADNIFSTANDTACLVGASGGGVGERCNCPPEKSEVECKVNQGIGVIVGTITTLDAPAEAGTVAMANALGNTPTYEGPESIIACSEQGTCSSDDISGLASDSYEMEGNITDPQMSKMMKGGAMIAMLMMPPGALIGAALMVADMFITAVDPYGYNTILLKETFDNLYADVDGALSESIGNIYKKCMIEAGAEEVVYLSKTDAKWWCETPEAEGGGKEKCNMESLIECISYIPVDENAEPTPTYEFYPKPPLPFCNPETDQSCERSTVFNAALRKYAREDVAKYIDNGMDPSITTEYKDPDTAGYHASESLSEDDPLNKNKMGMIIPVIAGLLIMKGQS